MPPSASICVTTYNRSAGLRQAVESALRQDHADLEVIICDNASADDTPKVAAELCAGDSRVRYHRHPENLGPVRNFMSGLAHCRGRYFMWLADDDWLEANYLSTCLAFLEAHPGHALACGRIRYYKQGQYSHDGRVVNLEQEQPRARLLDYYRRVGDNGTYYGLMRLAQVKQVPMRQVVGTDWFFVAGMAWQGQVRSLEATTIHRDYTWDGGSFARIARSEGATDFDARRPYLAIANDAFTDIMSQPLYAALPASQRVRLALAAFTTVCRSKKVRLNQWLPAALRLLARHGGAMIS